MAIQNIAQGVDFPFGPNADVRLEYTDANTLTLVGVAGTSKRCFVQGSVLDLTDGLTLDTDSASDYLISESAGSVSIGSGALSTLTTGYNDYTILYLYLTDNHACWNFSSPTAKDYRNSLIISDAAPSEAGAYMSTSGEGRYARHVGWVALNSSRQTDNVLGVASAFNELPASVTLEGTTASWTGISHGAEITAENCSAYVVCPAGSTIDCNAIHRVRNDSATLGNIDAKIVFDSTDKSSITESLGNTTGQKEYYSEQISHVETMSSTEVYQIKANLAGDGSGSSLDYYPDRSIFVIARIPQPSQPGYTRQATGIAPAPDYTPPAFTYKDADEITIKKGRYYQCGYRLDGQYQDLENAPYYWDVSADFDVDVDDSANLVGGDVVSSWYSVFLTAQGSVEILPCIRVDALDYNVSNAGKTTINPADHADGTTANDSFVSAADCFNTYRLLLLCDTAYHGTVYTIEDSVDGTPDEIVIDGDVSAEIAATEWLQMIPPSGTACLYLGTIGLDGSGDLLPFDRDGKRCEFRVSYSVNGNLSTSYAKTDVGSAIPPTARKAYFLSYPSSTSTNTYSVSAWFSADGGTSTKFWILINKEPLDNYNAWVLPTEWMMVNVSAIWNKFQQDTGSAVPASSGTIRFYGYEE